MLARQSCPQTSEAQGDARLASLTPAPRDQPRLRERVPQMSSRHAASQVCAIGTRAIEFVTPHRNTIEIMRLFATYHSAHSRFTV
jgi:hypothetical protein